MKVYIPGVLIITLLSTFSLNAFAQAIGIGGPACQIFAGDCSTIVSIQPSSMSIILKGGKYSATCSGTLAPALVPSIINGKRVECDFKNTGQECIVDINQESSNSCQSLVNSSNSNVQITSDSNNTVTVTNADSSQSTISTSINSANWIEVIKPNGQVSITCKAVSVAACTGC